MIHRLSTLVASLLLALTLAHPATAQTHPTPGKPVTIIVGFAAGGGHDVMARALAQELTKQLGTSVVVENRPGAGGGTSVTAVARSDPDGHTLLFNSLSELAFRQAVAKVPYDLERDVVPISLVGVTPIALVVNEKVPAKTMAEFVKYAKSTPDGVIYGSPGVGTLQHFGGEVLRHKLGLPMTHLAFRGGGPLANDLAGGHVVAGMSGLPPLVPLIDSGKVRLIATSSSERSKLTPDVQSYAEVGVDGVDIANYVGLAAPKGTPDAILKRLEQAALTAAKSPEMAAIFKRSFSSVIGTTKAEYEAFIAKERKSQSELIRAMNFKIIE
jgi:tripartite-type tricarboxylate transporter receptor subunit TctC